MKFKLDKDKISNMAVFSTALLTPSIIYATTMNESVDPARVGLTCMVVGGALAFVLFTKKGFEKKRLYELHKNAIPLQEDVIRDLEKARKKNSNRGINNDFLDQELDFEKSYLDMLNEEESYLCETLNLDMDDEKQMKSFMEEAKTLKKRRRN